MAAIRLDCDNSITVLIEPWKDDKRDEILKGVYLTRNYKNASGILPEENMFISNSERWFFWLGYYNNWQEQVLESERDNIAKVFNYIHH